MTDWKQHALCAGDSRFTSTDPRDQAEAIAICAGCPVTGKDGPCHEWAAGEDYEGVAAGMVWKGKKQTNSSANRPGRYADWTVADMQDAHNRHAAGDRQPWTIEGHMAYKAWRKRVMRKSRAA